MGELSRSCEGPGRFEHFVDDHRHRGFVVIWFVAAAVNMWIGVSQAGYSFQKELPIFLLIFLLPVAVAVAVKWKFL